MNNFVSILLIGAAFAQFIPPKDTAKAVPAKTYTLTADQKERLKKAGDAHKACMNLKDAGRRNDCFHPTHHAAWQACEQIKSELKSPNATCDLETLTVKQ